MTTYLVVVPRAALAAALVPGVIAGALWLAGVAPTGLQLGAYLALLPLILLQAARTRVPVRREDGARVLAVVRVLTSLNAWLVAFALSYTLASTGVARGVAYQLLVATLIVDAHLLYRFFRPSAQAPLEAAA